MEPTESKSHIAKAANLLRPISGELSGAFGDLGTFLPYVVAAVGTGLLAPTPVFVGFAAGYLLVAALYRLPIAVQPMKALGAVIIAGGLTASETAVAGTVIGIVLLLLAATPALNKVARAIPQSIVTGLQAGLGLLLGAVALNLIGNGWSLALPALAVLGLSFIWRRGPWALVVVLGAVAIAPAVGPQVTPAAGIDHGAAAHAILSGVAAQLPLTLLNAVVVAAAVARTLYPHAAASVSERKLAMSSGLLNLIFAPLGAMPMCHGAGGIAAHHRFGARGLGTPLVLAAFCGTAALTGPVIIDRLMAIPSPVVGALLAFAAVDLVFSRRMFDARLDCRPVIAIAAFATFFWGAMAGLIAGFAAETLRVYLVRKLRSGQNGQQGQG